MTVPGCPVDSVMALSRFECRPIRRPSITARMASGAKPATISRNCSTSL